MMKSAGPVGAGEQLQHSGCSSPVGPPCLEPLSSEWSYSVTGVAAAGTYYLTANFTTWHMDQDLSVAVNGEAAVVVPVFYTVGWWNETEPIAVTLAKGTNTLSFTRTSGRPVVFKDFFLYKSKPVVQAPEKAYVPTPSPPFPNASQYVEGPFFILLFAYFFCLLILFLCLLISFVCSFLPFTTSKWPRRQRAPTRAFWRCRRRTAYAPASRSALRAPGRERGRISPGASS